MKKKRYLFVIPSLVGGGAERVMVTLANNLSEEADIKIFTITSAECFYSLSKNVKIESANSAVIRKNLFTLICTEVIGAIKSIHSLNRIVQSWKPDTMVVFLHETILLTLIAKKIYRWKSRIIVSERADPTKRGSLNARIEKTIYPYADMIVCQSKNVADFFDSKFQKKIKVIPNPICSEAIPQRYEGVRKKRIIGVGRLFPQKNFGMLIDAFSQLDDKYKDYTLEIYGLGFLKDQLQKQIEDLGIEDRAKLMGQQSNVMHYVADASLFVLSSDYEGFPNVLVEAMATGLPVITTNFSPGNAPEIVKPENGIVIPTGDTNALKDAIEKILSNQVMANEMSKANIKILDLLSEKRICDLWKCIL